MIALHTTGICRDLALANTISGTVVELSPGGNLITDIETNQLGSAPRDEALTIRFGGHETYGLFEDDHGQPEGTLVAKINSAGRIEIEIVGLNLSQMLGIPVGEAIEIAW